MTLEQLEKIQNTINYKFDNVDLLQQAFVRRSYSSEYGGEDNEVLEFIGDKSLDLAVIRILMDKYGEVHYGLDGFSEFRVNDPDYKSSKSKEGKFTNLKRELVESKALANCITELGLNEYLILGKGDRKMEVQNKDSVKEDLFEAIIGAVTIDSDYDLDVITDVVETMIDFDKFFEEGEDDNYVGLVQEWCSKHDFKNPSYEYEEEHTLYGDYKCKLAVEGFEFYFIGRGESKAKARMDAASAMYSYLDEHGYIEDPILEAIGEADEDRAISQLKELADKRLIEEPIYEFSYYMDNRGKTLWDCVVTVEGHGKASVNGYPTKQSAKKDAAYIMLKGILTEEDY